MEKVQGKLFINLFRNDDNGYTVCKIRLDNQKKIITLTGYLPVLNPDVDYEFEGEYVTHPKYGLQFKAESYQSVVPSNNEGLLLYLTSASFPGIGRKTAQKLIDDLGEDLIRCIQEDPEVLNQFSYLNDKKRDVLKEGLIENNDEDEKTYRFFTSHGLTMKQIIALRNYYDENVTEILTENPYRIVYEVGGFGFKTADKLGLSLGFDYSDMKRLEALGYSLLNKEIMGSGDSYLLLEDFESYLSYQLNGLEIDIDTLINNMLTSNLVVIEQDRIYSKAQYQAEVLIGSYFRNFPYEGLLEKRNIEDFIGLVSRQFNIEYDESQLDAIHQFFENDCTILTGGPGTGKTTIVKAIISIAKLVYPASSIALVAPTGKAARRLKELTGYEAKTIHSLLKFDLETGTFGMDRDNPLLFDILIVDEFSMVDQYVLSKLLDAGACFKKILFIGDEDQLPSVAPGQVLKDFIDSERFPIVRLQHIYRQKEGSGIISLAYDIANDMVDNNSFDGVTFIDSNRLDINKIVEREYQKQLEIGYQPTDVQVLAPMYNGTNGIDQLNITLQNASNPSIKGKRELSLGIRTLRIGDKILQLKNQPEDNVFNGDIGILNDISFSSENQNKKNMVEVNYEGIHVQYQPEDYEKITHGFAISVHKAQGSQYPVIIMPICKDYGIMLKKRLIYTGITRAEKELILIGERDSFIKGVRNYERERKTTLINRLGGE